MSHLPTTERLAIQGTMARAVTELKERTGRASVAFVAKVTGTNESTTKAYLNGLRRPPVTFVRDLAQHAGVPATELFVALGWLPASEAANPDARHLAEQIAAAAATLGRLEPHARRTLSRTDLTAPAISAATAALLSGIEGASRFDVRLFQVVSGNRYPGITSSVAEFSLRPKADPLATAEVDRLAHEAGDGYRPDAIDESSDPGFWAVRRELRSRTYAALHDSDVGQFTWQGEACTHSWSAHAQQWPAHLLVQDPHDGVSRPGHADAWRPVSPRTIVVMGNRYSTGAAALLAEALGWQFLPVRADMEVTMDGSVFPVSRDPVNGRVLAWNSVARLINRRYREGEPWRAVVLLRPSALHSRAGIDAHAAQLLRDTPATVVYARPPRSYRQRHAVLPDRAAPDHWDSATRDELCAVETAMAERTTGDLRLRIPEPGGCLEDIDAVVPDEIADVQARVAWTVLCWLDEVANRGRPSIRERLFPGQLASWIPDLARDPDAILPAID